MTCISDTPRIKVGDKIPSSVSVKILNTETMQPTDIKVSDIFAGKRGILVALPGAFTPLCHGRHLPGFIKHAEEIKAKHKFDVIAAICVNDAFTMHHWATSLGTEKAGIIMLADGNGTFTNAVGMMKDATAAGMLYRSHRYAAVIDDNVVIDIGLDDQKGQCEHSCADKFLTEYLPSKQ